MNKDRLNQLFDFYKEDPKDAFVIYGLATEYASDENWEEALKYYEILLTEHEEYTGTYYHAAFAYAENGQADLAEATYKKGIEVCARVKDAHALKELKAAYMNFQMEDDDEEW
ncbi:tetratricopeptide repeat protein [Flammeovirga pectinis]|uniref:Tetratricopeptide repeat protein n=1 Tax=Flammeovirga pectinis TaxID=2494373 RepID=A0A3Q9FPM0_9BACT|nr:tetratricopeptide repeat protein [Flammeovirga pectinis]